MACLAGSSIFLKITSMLCFSNSYGVFSLCLRSHSLLTLMDIHMPSSLLPYSLVMLVTESGERISPQLNFISFGSSSNPVFLELLELNLFGVN